MDRTGCQCGGDRGQDRRSFLREVIGAGSGLFLALGLEPSHGLRLLRGVPLVARAGMVSYPTPASDGVTIDTENEVILARRAGVVHAFALSCPHQRTMLKWLAADDRFQCPKHKSKYRPDGTFISGRATRNMDRHPIRLEAGRLLVDVDTIVESDKDPAGWAAAQAVVS